MLHAVARRKDMKRYIFFTDDATGEAAANATFARLYSGHCQPGRARNGACLSRPAQGAIKRWGKAAQDDLSFVRVPTLIANGDNDAMVPTPNSNAMHEKIVGSRLVLYPHSGHGSLFQYPNEFAGEVNEFWVNAGMGRVAASVAYRFASRTYHEAWPLRTPRLP